ncbi:hypothetical protein Tco_1492101 [Tanacetum coccineum]
MVFGRPFIDETGLVYNEEEGTVMFEQDDEIITFKMPRIMEVQHNKMTSKALPMLKMTSLSSSLETCTSAWIFYVLTYSGTIVVCMSWINFPPIHAACL